MTRTMFRRLGADPVKRQPDSNKRGFRPKNTLSEAIQGTRKPETTGKLFTNSLKKMLRWAYLSAPAIALPACSGMDNEKMHAGNISLAAIGSMTVVLGVACLCAAGVKKLLNRNKSKKENKTD